MKVEMKHFSNPKNLLIGGLAVALCLISTPVQAESAFPVYFAQSDNRTWFAESGLSSHVAQVKEIDAAGNVTVILSGLMLNPGAFLNPIVDLGYENGVLWVAHRQLDVNGNSVDAISAFDPDDAVNTFTTIASAPIAMASTEPTEVTDVTPGEDPARTIIAGSTQGFIVLMPGNLRDAPLPNDAPLGAGEVAAGEDPRRTAAGGASIDDLNDLLTLPGEFVRPAPTSPPDPVTSVTPGEDPRRTSGEGVSFPVNVITVPGTIQGATPDRAPTPVTVISPGEDPSRAESAGPKQEQRKSVTILNVKKIKN